MLAGCIVLRQILHSEKSYSQFLRKQEKKKFLGILESIEKVD
jgi:hypothetical protein